MIFLQASSAALASHSDSRQDFEGNVESKLVWGFLQLPDDLTAPPSFYITQLDLVRLHAPSF